jgi:Methyltransferase domain
MLRDTFKTLFDAYRARAMVTEPPAAAARQTREASLGIEQFSYFAGYVVLRGWIHRPSSMVRAMYFQVGAQGPFEITELFLPNAQAPAPDCGFAVSVDTRIDAFSFLKPSLRVVFDDGCEQHFEELGIPEILRDRGHRLFPEFIERVRAMPTGRLLEIGSRARSGVSRRDVAPAGWTYTGLDIMEGPNVDIVGDAHAMSQLLPHGSFDAAMSLSVLEHLAMPWKVALELNRVLKCGGFAFVQTHQTFPLHDEPWDFWRVSKDAWPALFNAKTGFKIVESAMAEPLMFVAKRWHPGVNLHESRGCAVSSVLVEKTGDSKLSWDVDLSDVLTNHYPE